MPSLGDDPPFSSTLDRTLISAILAAFSSSVMGWIRSVDSSKSECPVLLACSSRFAMLDKILPHSLHLYDCALVATIGSSISASSWWAINHSTAPSTVAMLPYNIPFWARSRGKPMDSVSVFKTSGSSFAHGSSSLSAAAGGVLES